VPAVIEKNGLELDFHLARRAEMVSHDISSFIFIQTGLGLGLNAVNQIGNDMRDSRQEGEIRSTQSELIQSRQREADMAARLQQLEANQAAMQYTPAQLQELAKQQAAFKAYQQQQQLVPQ
jgi:hypothetical protein